LSDPTSSAADTRVNRSPSPAPGEAPTTNATSGPISETPWAFYDPNGRCWRMSQGTLDLGLETSSPTWPRAGMTSNGIAYQRPPLVRLTSDGDSSRLHTPTAKANQATPSMRSRDPGSWFWPTPKARDWKGPEGRAYAGTREDLPSAVMWPTPTRADAEGGPGTSGREGGPNLRTRVTWPTPTADDADNVMRSSGEYSSLTREVQQSSAQTGGSLNPTWVEWLMGFPVGWTDLEG